MAGERVSAIHCSARTINVYNVLRKLTQSVVAAVVRTFAFSPTLVASSSRIAVARNTVHGVDCIRIDSVGGVGHGDWTPANVSLASPGESETKRDETRRS